MESVTVMCSSLAKELRACSIDSSSIIIWHSSIVHPMHELLTKHVFFNVGGH